MSGTGNEQMSDPARSQVESASCKRERWQTGRHGAEWQVAGVHGAGKNQGSPEECSGEEALPKGHHYDMFSFLLAVPALSCLAL